MLRRRTSSSMTGTTIPNTSHFRSDVEPSGEAVNVISLEEESGRPENPMINAGAILTHSLVRGADDEERFARILDLFSKLAGRELSVDEQVFASAWSTTPRNLAMGHMLKIGRASWRGRGGQYV